jgi:hypothetical protein
MPFGIEIEMRLKIIADVITNRFLQFHALRITPGRLELREICFGEILVLVF